MALKELILIFAVMLTVMVVAGTGYAAAAPPREVWNKTYGGAGGERAYLVLQTADGGYLTAGRIKICDECTSDVWIVKTDSNGNEEWNRTFKKTGNSWIEGDHILQTSDGGYIVAGPDRFELHGVKRSEFWVNFHNQYAPY